MSDVNVIDAVLGRYEVAVHRNAQTEERLAEERKARNRAVLCAETAKRERDDMSRKLEAAQVERAVAVNEAKAACERAANCKARIKGLTADQRAAFATIIATLERNKDQHQGYPIAVSISTLRRLVGNAVAP